MGSQEPLGDKTITVVVATDFVNVSFINFCCNKKQTAQVSAHTLYNIITIIFFSHNTQLR